MQCTKTDIQRIVESYSAHKNKDMFLEQLMLTGGNPKQINKFLPDTYKQQFTKHFNHCQHMAYVLSDGFCL
ncbi:TPA: hypothetical protein L3V69_000538 [Vibrio parahaemolyticus]|uniref:hypothetical protein n=1 Tax=Vibrio TaxID=662 RepID=UPI000794CE4F|nr:MULTISPECIES: hypothetical protein [Vibrio]EHR5760994.1 hypothetical protein [Vibrio parahaemolyticus]EIV8506858.1 hypothetical protein [Vibrio parahaemolyticus]ELA9813214.1 hypothetical protein [Vibrio parahaemolyticus]ELA9876688.1 hypothetical protein [Vibrio parahaemolyticus]ELA9888379.1 hypothetical protein [Vibrio parahaemolyticus]